MQTPEPLGPPCAWTPLGATRAGRPHVTWAWCLLPMLPGGRFSAMILQFCCRNGWLCHMETEGCVYVMNCFTRRRRRWAIFGRAGARSNSKRCFALTTSTISRINRVSIGYSSSQLAVDFTWNIVEPHVRCLVLSQRGDGRCFNRRDARGKGCWVVSSGTKNLCETRVLRW